MFVLDTGSGTWETQEVPVRVNGSDVLYELYSC